MSITVKLVERPLKNGGSSFYIETYDNGKRGYVPVDIKIDPKVDDAQTRKEKQQILNALRSQIELELLSKGTEYVPKHRKNIDFYDYLDNYIESYNKKDKRMVFCAIQKFMDFVDKDVLFVTDVNRKLAEGFKDYLLSSKAGLSGETPKNYLTRFKKVVKAAVRDEILRDNPFTDVMIKMGDTNKTIKKEVLTADEIRTLSSTPCGNELVKSAFLFSCFTGLGLAEIKKLNTSQTKGGRLKVSREKTSIEINIPLSETARKILDSQEVKDGFYFPITVSSNAVNKTIGNWIERAKIKKKITFYCARHTFATQLLRNGADLVSVSKCMGQTSVKHTVKYLNHVDDLVDNAIDKLPAI